MLEGFLVDDDLVSIDQVLFQLVGKDSFKGSNLIRVSDFLDNFSYFIVEVSGFD